MSERKPFLLRLDPELHRALQKWADDDLRSLNGQLEYLLRDALRRAGRLPRAERNSGPSDVLHSDRGSPPSPD